MPQADPSKTEKATSKRRDKLRKDGNIAKGEEITKVMVLLAGILALRFLIGFYHDQFVEIYRWTFTEALNITLDKSSAYWIFVWSLKKMAIMVLPFMLIIAGMAYLVLRIQVGKLWTTNR